MIKNYSLFEKHLDKISATTIEKFGGLDNIIGFLQSLIENGNMIAAAKKSSILKIISPLYLYRIINNDKALNKCVSLAIQLATNNAEGVLYDRAINGYEELTYNKEGECVSRKKKYCSKSLLEYLKANSLKYKSQNKTNKNIDSKEAKLTSQATFEVESYGSQEK